MSPHAQGRASVSRFLLAVLHRQSYSHRKKSPLALYRLTLCVRLIARARPYLANRKGTPYVHHRNRL